LLKKLKRKYFYETGNGSISKKRKNVVPDSLGGVQELPLKDRLFVSPTSQQIVAITKAPPP